MNASLLILLSAGTLSVAGDPTQQVVRVEARSIVATQPVAITTPTSGVVLVRCDPIQGGQGGAIVSTPAVGQITTCTPCVPCTPCKPGSSTSIVTMNTPAIAPQACSGATVVRILPGSESTFVIDGSHASNGLTIAGAGHSHSTRVVRNLQDPAIAPQVVEIEADTPDADDVDEDMDEPEMGDDDAPDADDGSMSFDFTMPEGLDNIGVDVDAVLEQAQQQMGQQSDMQSVELREVLKHAQEVAREAQAQSRDAMREATENARGAYQRAMEESRAALKMAEQDAARNHDNQRVAEVLRAAQSGLHGSVRRPIIAELAPEARSAPSEDAAPSGGGDLESRVAALERLAKQQGHTLRSRSAPDGSQSSLEDRVSELERLLSGHSRGSQSWVEQKSPKYKVYGLGTGAAGEAPRAQPFVWKVPSFGGFGSAPGGALGGGGSGNGVYVYPKTPSVPMLTTPPTPAAPVAPMAPRMAGPMGFPRSGMGSGLFTKEPPSSPDAPTTPAPAARSDDPRREEIQRAMKELRAEAERLRTEMARLREQIDQMPRNQDR